MLIIIHPLGQYQTTIIATIIALARDLELGLLCKGKVHPTHTKYYTPADARLGRVFGGSNVVLCMLIGEEAAVVGTVPLARLLPTFSLKILKTFPLGR